MTAPTAPASLREDVALREAVAAYIYQLDRKLLLCSYPGVFSWETAHDFERAEYREKADALLTAPLAARDAERDALIATLRARLEIDKAFDLNGEPVPFPDGMPDGIECRDETIRGLEDQAEKLRAKRDTLKAALAAAQDRISGLEMALDPFAHAASECSPEYSADDVFLNSDFIGGLSLTVGDLRAARSARYPEEMHDER